MELIWGRHAVTAALEEQRPLNKLYVADHLRHERLPVLGMAKAQGVPVQFVPKSRLDQMSEGGVHQGLVASISESQYAELDHILHGPNKLILAIDSLEDPHNLGALLRTAEAAGVDGVVIGRHRSVGLTGAAAKASAGAASRIPVARVANLVQALEKAKEMGFWAVGLEADGDEYYTDVKLTGPLVVVVGGEDKGLTRLVREHCDWVVKIPMQSGVSSLNASVAGALLLYEVVRQRRLHG